MRQGKATKTNTTAINAAMSGNDTEGMLKVGSAASAIIQALGLIH